MIYSVIQYFKNAVPTIIIRTKTSTLLISNVNKICDCYSRIIYIFLRVALFTHETFRPEGKWCI